jgi:hypothetical protein
VIGFPTSFSASYVPGALLRKKMRVVVSLSKTTLLCWTTYTLTVRILQFVLFYYFLTKNAVCSSYDL